MRSIKKANGALTKRRRTGNPDDTLTPAEAKKVRHGIQQIKQGRFKLWRDVKNEMGR